ncbi:MAG TPA: periplasmic heavy metal sensor [Methylomirabilota bacterium]|nr:periplasmic heavy metal sensor [Methylomirabilota bacterium]
MNKTVKMVFLGSLVLNVLLLGVLLGRLPHRFERAPSRQERVENSLKEFPEPARTRFRDTLERMRHDGEPIDNQIQQTRDEILRIIVNDPFDEAAFDRQIAKINELRIERAGIMTKIIKDVVKNSTPDQRKMLVDMLKRAMPPRSSQS